MASVIQAGTASNTALTLSSDTSGELQLKTNSGSTTAMTLTTGGLVGIGTTSPSTTLDVQAASPSFQVVATTGTNRTYLRASNTSGLFYLAIDSSTGSVFGSAYARVLYGTGAYPMNFYTNATERMRIDSSGNVGIGTSSPSYKLDITDATTTTEAGGIRLTLGSEARSHLITNTTPNAASGRDLGILAWRGLTLEAGNGTTEGVLAGNAYEYITFGTGSSYTERMRITSGGDVLVGSSTSSVLVSNQLQLGSTSNSSAGLQILNSTTGTGGIYYGDSTTGNARFAGYIEYSHTDNAMVFATAEGQRMRITSGGLVGIGVSPSYPLDLSSGASARTVQINSTAANGVGLALQTSGTDNILLGSYKWAIGSGNATDSIMMASGFLAFGAGSSERMRITSDGYVGIGTSTPASYGALAVRKGVNGTWLGVSGNCSFQTSDAVISSLYVVHSTANSNTTFIGADSGGRLQMFCSATASGGVYLANGGTSWTSASDERVKENLAPIQNGLEKVTSLRAVTGNFINDENKKSRAFLIAQDVQKVFPQAVDSSNPDELGLAYTDVIPLLVAAMKEQQAMIEELTNRVKKLEGVK